MDEAKKVRTSERRKFNRAIKLFEESVKQDDPTEILKPAFDEVSSAYKRLENANDDFISCIDESHDDYASLLAAAEDYITEVYRLKCKAHSQVLRKIDGDKSKQKTDNTKFIVKKLEPPKFDGQIRLYPTFRKDFERLMITNYGEDPYVLKQCLLGEALKVVHGVDDDYHKMMDRLDDKFGNVTKVVDSVLCEIRTLKPVPEGNNKKLVELVNTVERGWLDVCKLDLKSEMNNTTVISQVEKLLPPTLKREWVLKASEFQSEKEFDKLLEFLVKERKVIEYIQEGVRSSATTDKVAVHSVAYEDHCYSDKFNEAIKQLRENQESQQRQLNECIVSMNQIVSNLSGQARSKPKVPPNVCKNCWFHGTTSHSILECSGFQNLNNNSKYELLRSNRVCFICLRKGHFSSDCMNRELCHVKGENNEVCGKPHHPILHTLFVQNAFTSQLQGSNNLLSREGVLLMIGHMRSKGQKVATLWDPGSNLTMITHRMANKLGLRGKDVSLTVTKVGNSTEQLDSKIYKVPITDLTGTEWTIEACGINEITSDITEADTAFIARLFGVEEWEIDRPTGKVDLLIGADHSSMIPEVVRTIDNLQLMQNNFGVCVRGSHPVMTRNIGAQSFLTVKINHMTVAAEVNDIIPRYSENLSKQLNDFFSIENFGTSCIPRCSGCKCGKCSLSGEHSLREEAELKQIEEGLGYDSLNGYWIASYPWIKDPNKLPNNVSLAYGRLKSTERRLIKLGSDYSQKYNDQILDMVHRGVARKLNIDELNNYNGPVHYLPHHEVHKPDSSSTPLRIVFNSSSSYFGHVLNDYFAKGPDVLNSMIGILIRFRQRAVAIVADIKKMYNSVRISELDQHTHRFLWRDLETDREPDHYALTTVTFGDRPSGIIAMMALRKTTEMDESFPLTAEMINRNSYVDDILSSVSTTKRAKRSIAEANVILSRGGFQIKQWVMSGENPEDHVLNILKTDKEKVLGLNWNPKEDLFFYVTRINFSNKVKNVRMEPPIEKSEIDEKLPSTLTRRMVLSQAASVYDPLGFIVPFTLKAKLLMRDLITTDGENEQKLGWDEVMPQYMYDRWRKLFKEMYELETLTFHRCVKPEDAVDKPVLVIFADASKLAYGACAYLRWKVREGPFVSKLLIAKNRIAPTRQLTIPRLELCGAVLACRLREMIEREIDIELESVIHVIDSSIVRAQICNRSSSFNVFVATRVAEIQTKSKIEEWFWTSSGNNPADFTTRPTHPVLLNSNSLWQNGPPFMCLPVSEWPVSQSNDLELPDVAPVKTVNVLCRDNTVMIDISRYSSYNKLLRVTARVLNAVKLRSFKGVASVPHSDYLKAAEDVWVRWVQRTIGDDWERKYERLGAVMNEKGLICVGQRISEWLKDNWNMSVFILLPRGHSFTRLYVKHIHEIDHAGVEVTLAKLQSKFWVPGARKLIKSVKARCVICRKLDKKTGEQCMGQCPPERLQPAPPFFNTAIDLFGPFIVKDTVKRRTSKKVYGIIFNCMVSRAVYLDLAEGYDTESFLMTLRRFVSIRGFPKRMHSDGGTQLVAANKELRTMTKNWNMTQIAEFGNGFGMSWTFNKSADAPWENGCSESLIKSVKRCIMMSVGTNILSWSELQTCMFEIANLLNGRPIGLKPGYDPSLGIYLCPNDLLLGRTGIKVPSGLWDESDNPRQSFEFMQRIVNSFWKRWQRDYFPSLIVRQKWHTQRRNLRPGDIVLIHENNSS